MNLAQTMAFILSFNVGIEKTNKKNREEGKCDSAMTNQNDKSFYFTLQRNI